jgi:DNA modification methylase
MELISHKDYINFRKTHPFVIIEKVKVSLPVRHEIKKYAPEFKPEKTTVWSFPDRGDWATHRGNYRGNWSPFIPRNLILRYTEPKDLVLDQMVGSGTTLIECKLLGRNAIGVDINRDAIMVARNRLNFPYTPLDEDYTSEIRTFVGDARNLNLIDNETIDLIATHPPYAGIISYSEVEGDLSKLKIEKYVEEMKKVAEESYRVLKPDHCCAILVGDTRKHKHYIPISAIILRKFLEVGFVLKEDIIKQQWKMKTTREKWRGNHDFYLIAHEHLYIFRKTEKRGIGT